MSENDQPTWDHEDPGYYFASAVGCVDGDTQVDGGQFGLEAFSMPVHMELSDGVVALLLHFMICHSNKCHRPRTSSCHKEQRGGTEYG